MVGWKANSNPPDLTKTCMVSLVLGTTGAILTQVPGLLASQAASTVLP